MTQPPEVDIAKAPSHDGGGGGEGEGGGPRAGLPECSPLRVLTRGAPEKQQLCPWVFLLPGITRPFRGVLPSFL